MRTGCKLVPYPQIYKFEARFYSIEVAESKGGTNFASDISTSQALLLETVSLPDLICLSLATRTACNSYLNIKQDKGKTLHVIMPTENDKFDIGGPWEVGGRYPD